MNKQTVIRLIYGLACSFLLLSCGAQPLPSASSSSSSSVASSVVPSTSSAIPSSSSSSTEPSSSSSSSATSEDPFPTIPENLPFSIPELSKPATPPLPFALPDFANPSAGLTYVLNETGTAYSVSNANNGLSSPNLVIPETYQGLPVTAIASEGFTERTWISSVAIPKTIMKIGDGAFSLTNIRQLYFDAATCQDFNARNWVFYPAETSSGMTIIIGKDVQKLPARFLYPLVTEPTKLPTISGVYFEAGSQLTSLGDYAFYHCTGLTDLVLPESLRTIGDYAFSGTALTSLYLNDGLLSLGDYAGSATLSLASVRFPASLTHLGQSAFFYSGITGADLSACLALTNLSVSAFKDCAHLVLVNTPKAIAQIGESCFAHDTALTNVYFGDEAKSLSLETSAFEGCLALKELYLPKNLVALGQAAFKDCAAVTTLYYACADLQDFASANEIFRNFGQATQVLFAASVSHLPSRLFFSWSEESSIPDIKEVDFLSPNLQSIGAYAFFALKPTLIRSNLSSTAWKSITVADHNDLIGDFAAKEAAK